MTKHLNFSSKTNRIPLGLLGLGLLLAAAAYSFNKPADEKLAIRSDEKLHHFSIEIAANNQQRAKGFMYRTQMDDSHGMLFIFDRPHDIHMWMKNTLIPLDMLFISPAGKIEHIHKNAEPESLIPIHSGKNVSAVLELKGGTSERLGIQKGDMVEHDAFSN